MANLEKSIIHEIINNDTLSELLSVGGSQIRGVNFDGEIGSYIDVPYGIDPSAQDWSIMAVVDPTKLIKDLGGSPVIYSDPAILAQRNGTGFGRTIMDVHIQNGNVLTGETKYGSFLNGTVRDSIIDLDINDWAWLGMTYDLSEQILKMFVNGLNVGEFTGVLPEAADGGYIIGHHKNANGNMYEGNMSEFRAYSELVTEEEMLDWYEKKINPSKTLELEYLFEDGSGSTVVDTSGNGRDATIVGGVTWTENNPDQKHIYFGAIPKARLEADNARQESYLVINRIGTDYRQLFGYMVATMQFSIFSESLEDALSMRAELMSVFHRFKQSYMGAHGTEKEVKFAWFKNSVDMKDPDTNMYMVAVDCAFKVTE